MSLKNISKLLFTFTFAWIIISSCNKEAVVKPVDINFSELPYKSLSEYGFFIGNIADLKPNEKVVLYEPASSLFTDYAHKSRYIWMPENKQVKINRADTAGSLEFPDETVIIKNFYYPEDFSKPEGKKRIIETRLMVKNNDEWVAYPYVWNDAQTDAVYKVSGGDLEVAWTDEAGKKHNIEYIIPNKNQCKSCHNQNEKMMPIGVKVKHINFEIDYGNNEVKNQLEKWYEEGYLANYDFEENKKHSLLVDYRNEKHDLTARAKSYLDINCAHCHNPEGPASTSGLFLNYEENNPHRLGVFKTPVAAGFGSGSHTFDVVPGKADESIMIYRMNSTEVGAAMPEIGRVSVHDEGVQLIKDWINSLEGEKPEEMIGKRYL